MLERREKGVEFGDVGAVSNFHLANLFHASSEEPLQIERG
jgi:hypothetical protein